MKVTISVGGKFHAFHLAGQLEKRGYLDMIFTSYPWFAVKDSSLPRNKVKCIPSKEILDRGWRKIPYLGRKIDITPFLFDYFDDQVAKRLKPCGIFVGASGYSLRSIKRVRSLSPAKVIIECVSGHIHADLDILNQEEERLGVRLTRFSSYVVEKTLEEYNQADYIVVPSAFSRQTFLDKGFPEEKIICVPWGVDTELFRPSFKKDSAFRIIVVGMRTIKGIQYILQAVNELRLKDLEVCLIGGSADEGARAIMKKHPGNFRYLGAVPQRELRKHYSQGSLSVLFSLSDGFGMALLEAMACGLPVICSDRVGAKRAIRENIDGYVVPARDVKTLKEKINYLYENQEVCRQMGKRARENMVNNFTWGHYGEKVIAAYLKL